MDQMVVPAVSHEAVVFRDADAALARPGLHRYEGGFGLSHSTRCGRRAWANQKFPYEL